MVLLFFFFKQKTAYEWRISDWSSDVCSSDLVATRLTPTDGAYDNNINSIAFFWDQTYAGIRHANAITSFIDNVPDLDEATKQEYLGRAYFHRSFRYLALCFQYGDVPLVTKILNVQIGRASCRERVCKDV